MLLGRQDPVVGFIYYCCFVVHIQLFLVCCCFPLVTAGEFNYSVKVFHFMVQHWGESRNGLQHCGHIACDWTHGHKISDLKDNLLKTNLFQYGPETTTLALYNIHSWWEKKRDTKPATCELDTNYTMAESEESKVRYKELFEKSFINFDGHSTTHPASNLQRVYIESNFTTNELQTARNFSSLIKAASYVASDCHHSRGDSANAQRDGVVHALRQAGFRVDGLGRCMHQIGPEGITLDKSKDTRYNLHMKRDVIGRFMFNLAFENSLEPGYVTEKPFDAMMGGTVPVYLGDAEHLKSLLPHPLAAIFVSDFANISALAAHLTYLTTNETAYEEHRAWRHTYSVEKNILGRPLLSVSWFCRVCQWVVNQTITAVVKPTHLAKRQSCAISATESANNNSVTKIESTKAPSELNNKAVRGSSRQVYFVKNGVLHPVPDMKTFAAHNLDVTQIIVLSDSEMSKYIFGEPLPRTF